MKYVVKFGKRYMAHGDDTSSTIRDAQTFTTRASAMRELCECSLDWQENARIVRLRPKVKAAMIPAPKIRASEGRLFINGYEVLKLGSNVAASAYGDAIAKALALGLPESP